MSRFRFRRLERHKIGGKGDMMELAIPAPQSLTGKIHRCCPIPDCVPNLFQLGNAPSGQEISKEHAHLTRRAPNTQVTTCPYCGHDGPDDEFVFPGDIEAARDCIQRAVEEDAADILEQMARDFNRERRQDLLPINIGVERPRRSRPFTGREDLLRDLTCDICSRSYGVYAIGLFCPDCGARNLHVHFRREAGLVSQQLELAKKVEHDVGKELAYRLLGNAHEDVLTAFETYLKTIYRFLVKRRLPEQAKELGAKRRIGNSFQNIERGHNLFAKINIDPYKHLGDADLNFLRLNIEKRHVVGHNLSMADEAYTQAAKTEQPGQTVRLMADEISRFANICNSVVVQLEENSAEFLPPATGGNTGGNTGTA